MKTKIFKQLKNYFLTIKKIKKPIKVLFKYRNRIVFLPKDKIYISFLLNNLDKIEFQTKIQYLKILKVNEHSEMLEKIEKYIKNWIFDFLKENWKSIDDTFFKNLQEENLNLDNENYEWKIFTGELGGIGKILITINKYFNTNTNYLEKIKKLYLLFKLNTPNINFENFIEHFWIFAVLRNITYHYDTIDQLLLRGSLKLIEYDISKENTQKQKEEKFFEFGVEKDKKLEHKYFLSYKNINFFEKSFNILKNFIDFSV